MTRFADLPDLVLGPLAGRPDADWYRAPVGKWNAAQIVEHLSLSIHLSALGFEERRARDPMQRRPRTLFERAAYFLLLQVGVFPPGFKSPSRTTPAAPVDRATAETHFRDAHTRFREVERLLLPARATDLFVKHPRLGDLCLPEWLAFHVLHARHHTKQIRQRVAG